MGVARVAALSDISNDATPAKGPTVLFAVIAAIGFTGTFALGQNAADLSGEMPTTLISRSVAVAITVLVLLLAKLPFWPGKRVIPLLVSMGVADGIALFCVMSAGALPDAHYAAVASSMFGLLTILLAWALLKERMSWQQWGGCLTAFCGIGYLAL